jgi:hypothetical protein
VSRRGPLCRLPQKPVFLVDSRLAVPRDVSARPRRDKKAVVSLLRLTVAPRVICRRRSCDTPVEPTCRAPRSSRSKRMAACADAELRRAFGAPATWSEIQAGMTPLSSSLSHEPSVSAGLNTAAGRRQFASATPSRRTVPVHGGDCAPRKQMAPNPDSPELAHPVSRPGDRAVVGHRRAASLAGNARHRCEGAAPRGNRPRRSDPWGGAVDRERLPL